MLRITQGLDESRQEWSREILSLADSFPDFPISGEIRQQSHTMLQFGAEAGKR